MKKTKFIIFGQSRSGSTLLKELINSHPDIHCDGELLEPGEKYVTNRFLLKVFKRIPALLILFRQGLARKPIYGFTLFIYHIKKLYFWIDRLVASGYVIIYIRRKNTINQAFSNLVAQHTSFWHRSVDQKSDDRHAGSLPVIVIPVEKLLHVLKVRKKWRTLEQQALAKHSFLEVIYEDMLEDNSKWPVTMEKVFAFLGTFNVPVHSKLKKTYPRPYSEIVSNYNELIEAVKNSEFAYMLEHP